MKHNVPSEHVLSDEQHVSHCKRPFVRHHMHSVCLYVVPFVLLSQQQGLGEKAFLIAALHHHRRSISLIQRCIREEDTFLFILPEMSRRILSFNEICGIQDRRLTVTSLYIQQSNACTVYRGNTAFKASADQEWGWCQFLAPLALWPALKAACHRRAIPK